MSEPDSPRQLAWNRFKQNPLALFGLAWLFLCLLVATLGTAITPDKDPFANTQHLALAKLRPGQGHLLGTDHFGRDILSRIMLGTRISMAVGLCGMVLSVLIGALLGLLAGYGSARTDAVIMWVVSVCWSVPSLLLALAIAFVLGQGFWQIILAIGLSSWADTARMVRGQTLAMRTIGYVEAARALGYSQGRTLLRHVLPNISAPIIVMAVANFGAAVLLESGLSFLGIGLEARIPSWGRMMAEGYTQIVFSHGKWLAICPGMALMLLVISINLIGIGLRDALDTRLPA